MSKIDDSKLGHRERLRERLLQGGAGALADYEILEMILFLSQPRGDTKPLAKNLLKSFKTLSQVFAASPMVLMKHKGIGVSSVAALKLIHTVALRMMGQELKEEVSFDSLDALWKFAKLHVDDPSREYFFIFYLDVIGKFLGHDITPGTLDEAVLYPREIMKKALNFGATHIILAHNHPSGDFTASDQDIKTTKYLENLLHPMGITLQDHFVFGDAGYQSIIPF